MDYRTCQRIFLYLDKIRTAKKTLDQLTLRTDSPIIERMAKQRLSILERYEAELMAYMIGQENDLPYVPGSRCRAVVFWFATKRITESADVEDIIHKLHMGDRMMQNECLYVLSGENVSVKLKKLLCEHMEGIGRLQDFNIEAINRNNCEKAIKVV